MSRWLTPQAKAGLTKVGDRLVPGEGALPSFSQSGLIRNADRILDYLPEGDRKGLVGLAEALRFLPGWALTLLFWITAQADRFPAFLAAPLRQVDLGIRGFIFTLYYSDPKIREQLGWSARIRSETP